jgi:hypothetical protein
MDIKEYNLEQSFLNYHTMITMENLYANFLKNSMPPVLTRLFKKYRNSIHSFLWALSSVLGNPLLKNRLKEISKRYVN